MGRGSRCLQPHPVPHDGEFGALTLVAQRVNYAAPTPVGLARLRPLCAKFAPVTRLIVPYTARLARDIKGEAQGEGLG